MKRVLSVFRLKYLSQVSLYIGGTQEKTCMLRLPSVRKQNKIATVIRKCKKEIIVLRSIL
jgi:hypothetical protein